MKREDLLDKVENIAHNYELKYHGCAQCILGAFRDVLGENLINDDVFRAGSGLCGGVCQSGHVCGAVTGGMMVISLFKGRDYDNFADENKMHNNFEIGDKLIKKFELEYGSIDCRDIQKEISGRSYNFWSKEDLKAFEENEMHTKGCPTVVGKAAQWIMEILLDSELIQTEDV